jgi:hypothetical protein
VVNKGVIDTQVNVNYDSTGIRVYRYTNMTLNWDTKLRALSVSVIMFILKF